MSKQKIGLNEKKCAACRWWNAEREIVFWLKKPFKIECDAQGQCAARGQRTYCSASCREFAPWEKLP